MKLNVLFVRGVLDSMFDEENVMLVGSVLLIKLKVYGVDLLEVVMVCE